MANEPDGLPCRRCGRPITADSIDFGPDNAWHEVCLAAQQAEYGVPQ